MKPVLKAGLSGSGIMNTLPREICYGPISRQGLGIQHLYTEQGIQKLGSLLRWTQVSTGLSGMLQRTTLQELKMELGLNGSVLNHSFKRLGHLATKSWVKVLWQFLQENGLQIMDDIPDFEELRTGDQCLMELILLAGFTGRELRRINLC